MDVEEALPAICCLACSNYLQQGIELAWGGDVLPQLTAEIVRAQVVVLCGVLLVGTIRTLSPHLPGGRGRITS